MQNRKNAYCKCKIWNGKSKKKWTMHIKMQKVKWAKRRPSPMHSDKGERSACDTRLHFAFNFQIKRKSNFLWRRSWKTSKRLRRDSQLKNKLFNNASKEKLETWQFDFVLSVFFFNPGWSASSLSFFVFILIYIVNVVLPNAWCCAFVFSRGLL